MRRDPGRVAERAGGHFAGAQHRYAGHVIDTSVTYVNSSNRIRFDQGAS